MLSPLYDFVTAPATPNGSKASASATSSLSRALHILKDDIHWGFGGLGGFFSYDPFPNEEEEEDSSSASNIKQKNTHNNRNKRKKQPLQPWGHDEDFWANFSWKELYPRIDPENRLGLRDVQDPLTPIIKHGNNVLSIVKLWLVMALFWSTYHAFGPLYGLPVWGDCR